MYQAEKLGLDIFVHTMKVAVPVYQRLGFRIERELIRMIRNMEGPDCGGIISSFMNC